MTDFDQAHAPRPRSRFARKVVGLGVAALAAGALSGCNTSSNGQTPSVDYEAARFGSPEIDTADVANY